MNSEDELAIAAQLITEATGCDQQTARSIVDSIARYAILKAQGCLPCGWGQRG